MKKEDYGKRIKQFRQRAKLTQIELELRINASFGSISRIENGVTNPSKETLFLIANALGLNLDDRVELFGLRNPIEDSINTSLRFPRLYYENK
jgi:transcriptional regulator with XRE-family HTH domain